MIEPTVRITTILIFGQLMLSYYCLYLLCLRYSTKYNLQQYRIVQFRQHPIFYITHDDFSERSTSPQYNRSDSFDIGPEKQNKLVCVGMDMRNARPGRLCNQGVELTAALLCLRVVHCGFQVRVVHFLPVRVLLSEIAGTALPCILTRFLDVGRLVEKLSLYHQNLPHKIPWRVCSESPSFCTAVCQTLHCWRQSLLDQQGMSAGACPTTFLSTGPVSHPLLVSSWLQYSFPILCNDSQRYQLPNSEAFTVIVNSLYIAENQMQSLSIRLRLEYWQGTCGVNTTESIGASIN